MRLLSCPVSLRSNVCWFRSILILGVVLLFQSTLGPTSVQAQSGPPAPSRTTRHTDHATKIVLLGVSHFAGSATDEYSSSAKDILSKKRQQELDRVDERWRQRVQAAAGDGTVLQYVGQLSPDGVEVGVQQVSKESAFGRLEGQDNLFEIRTSRYAENPLTVGGPGAGPHVTATGVLSDILTVARMGTHHR